MREPNYDRHEIPNQFHTKSRTSLMILISIQLFVEVVRRWNNCGASGRYSEALRLPSSHRTLTVAATTPRERRMSEIMCDTYRSEDTWIRVFESLPESTHSLGHNVRILEEDFVESNYRSFPDMRAGMREHFYEVRRKIACQVRCYDLRKAIEGDRNIFRFRI